MLRTRLIVGTVLAGLAAGMLLLDEQFDPWFPFLFATVSLLSVLGTLELIRLLPAAHRPSLALSLAGVLVVVVLNWGPVIITRHFKGQLFLSTTAWAWVIHGFAALTLLAFLIEMARFQSPGGAVERVALTVWVVAYLGLLPSFL